MTKPLLYERERIGKRKEKETDAQFVCYSLISVCSRGALAHLSSEKMHR